MLILDTVNKIRSFGRLKGKGFSEKTKNLLENVLPKYSINNEESIDINTVFKNNNKNHLEIGFGYGESLLHKAQLYPDINFIGCEVYTNGRSRFAEKNTRYFPLNAKSRGHLPLRSRSSPLI